MANFIIKQAGFAALTNRADAVQLRAEEITDMPEKWLLEFNIKGMPGGRE